MKKKTIHDFNKMKVEGTPLTWITAYDYPLAYCAERVGIDMILVGDSGGMVQLGYSTTHPVTMDEMITMSKAVRRGAPNTFLVGDMPQGSYEISTELAIENALRFIKEAGCDAVKCEGGERVADKVKAMVDAGISVIGHLGLTPQSTESFGGYRVQGKTVESFCKTYNDMQVLENCGVFAILLEAMPAYSAYCISQLSKVPIYGIGAGDRVDGQLIIMHDLLGLYPNFRPHFAKCYIPDVLRYYSDYINNIYKTYKDTKSSGRDKRDDGLLTLVTFAIKQYVEEVKNHKFPNEEYMYSMNETETSLINIEFEKFFNFRRKS